MGKVTVEYAGCEGQGRTLTAAKAAAAAESARRLAGSYTPAVVARRDLAYLVWREPSGGWHSGRILDDGRWCGDIGGRCYGTHGHADRETVIAEAWLHVCQQTWTEADGDGLPTELAVMRGPANILRDVVSEWRSWVKWQLRYKAAQRAGLTDEEAHSFAGRNPALGAKWGSGGEWVALEAACAYAGL